MSSNTTITSVIADAIGTATFWVALGRIFGPTSTIVLHPNEPFSVKRKNYIAFSEVEVLHDNGNPLYYARHICPLVIKIGNNTY